MTIPITRGLSLCRRHCVKTIRRMVTESCVSTEHIPEIKLPHIPVMVNEVVENIKLQKNDVFLDMTFGAGGHSTALLERVPNLKVIALDRDPKAQEFAWKLKEKYTNQVIPIEGKFSDLPELLKEHNIAENSIDGVLFDLGCSSMQFDYPERGFSISNCGPLDMRMDGKRLPNQLTAADVIAYATETELYKIFKIYGEEKRARKIARALVEARSAFKPLTTTENLCELVETVCSGDIRHDKLQRRTHTATKIFQALRIFVNNEINELHYGISVAQKYLKPGGMAVVISFHSLEDRIVKRNFNNQMVDNCVEPLPTEFFNHSKVFDRQEVASAEKKYWQVLSKKVITPSEEEVFNNPRSRSAKLRAAAKL